MKLRTLAALATASLLPASALAAEHTYQVTGPVVSADSSSIVVKKGKDDWEIARGGDSTDLKPGDKVTIEYTMTAKKVEVKSAAKASGGTKTEKKAAGTAK
jgi:hypothetical protein